MTPTKIQYIYIPNITNTICGIIYPLFNPFIPIKIFLTHVQLRVLKKTPLFILFYPYSIKNDILYEPLLFLFLLFQIAT